GTRAIRARGRSSTKPIYAVDSRLPSRLGIRTCRSVTAPRSIATPGARASRPLSDAGGRDALPPCAAGSNDVPKEHVVWRRNRADWLRGTCSRRAGGGKLTRGTDVIHPSREKEVGMLTVLGHGTRACDGVTRRELMRV